LDILQVKLRSSPQRMERFAGQCRFASLEPKSLVLDVKTRWNSTFEMIRRALELRIPICSTIGGDKV